MIISNEEFAYKKWLKEHSQHVDMYTEFWLNWFDMLVPKVRIECKLYVFPVKKRIEP